MKIIWRKKNIDKEIFNVVNKEHKKSKLISTLIANRVQDKSKIENFLNPEISDLYSPFDLPDMDKAVDRVIQAIKNKENVLIYGDYDVDGMTSTALLFKYLKDQKLEPKYYIPNKIDEGYGFTKEAVDEILEKYGKDKINLIITVDCGSTSIKEVEYVKEKGIDIIITDHHEVQDEVPKAFAIVNPKLKTKKVNFSELAGVGVTFKLIMGIAEKLKQDKNKYLKFIDLVTLGTISDIVPMLSENRIICKHGLEAFKNSSNPVISLLYDKYKENFDENTISFQIAPRINASGRLGKEDIAMKFLLSETREDAEKYFLELDEINNERKILSDNMFESALIKIKEEDLEKSPIIILYDENWHAGVTGIVASKITDVFKRPSIIFSIENGNAKGSARTIPGINIYNLISKASKLLTEFGGHEKAAGLTVSVENLSKLKEILEEELDNEQIEIIEEYDYELKFNEINYDILKDIQELAPFGEKNHKPDFLFKKIEITSVAVYGSMLKLGLKQNNIHFVGIGFGLANKQDNLATKLESGDHIYLMGKLEENIYMGKSNIQINITDFNLLQNKV